MAICLTGIFTLRIRKGDYNQNLDSNAHEETRNATENNADLGNGGNLSSDIVAAPTNEKRHDNAATEGDIVEGETSAADMASNENANLSSDIVASENLDKKQQGNATEDASAPLDEGAAEVEGDTSGGEEEFVAGASPDAAPADNSKELRFFHNDNIGDFLVDPNNMSLYMFEKDHIGTGFTEADFEVNCYDECEIAWPPLIVQGPDHGFRAGTRIREDLLGVIQRTDGRMQLTYNFIPLYYYKGDSKAGDTNGHLINANGGLWYLITPDGLPITA